MACAMDAAQNRGRSVAPDGRCGLPDPVGAQVFRLDAGARGAQPGGALGPVAADCRCAQAHDQRNTGAHCRQQRSVFHWADSDHHASLGGLGGDPLWTRYRPGQHQRRPLVCNGNYFDGGLWRGDCRLGLQLQVLVFGCAARISPNGELRDRHGLLSGGGVDGVGQHEPHRHRDWPGQGLFFKHGAQLPVLELVASVADLCGVCHLRLGRDQPPPL